MSQPQVQAKIGSLNCSVTESQAGGFAKAWDRGGIKMILDPTSISFATAFANIALKSALEDPNVQMEIFKIVYARIKAAKGGQPQVEAAAPAQVEAAPAPAPEPAKSSIVLTDC